MPTHDGKLMKKKQKNNFHDVIIQFGMTTSGPGSDSLCLLTKPKVPLVLLLRPNKQTWQNKSWNESRIKLTVAIFDEWVFCQLC